MLVIADEQHIVVVATAGAVVGIAAAVTGCCCFELRVRRCITTAAAAAAPQQLRGHAVALLGSGAKTRWGRRRQGSLEFRGSVQFSRLEWDRSHSIAAASSSTFSHHPFDIAAIWSSCKIGSQKQKRQRHQHPRC